MSDHQVYLDTLDASLVAIERWLSGADTAPEAFDALLAPFSTAFTMILTDGREVDRDGTRALFAKLAGAKPGLRITLSETRVLAADASHAPVTFL